MTELQKLEQQVAELQATIERMKEPEPIKQWEPQHGRYIIALDGTVSNRDSNENYWKFGVSYKIQEQAEWASKQMRSFNRLLAYVAEFDVDENDVQWVPDWEDHTQPKYSIGYSNISKRFERVSPRYECAISGAVYMSEQCAKGLVDKLNSVEVVL